MKITQCNGTAHTTACSKRVPTYLVIHYTAGTSSKAGKAVNTANYFKSASAGGSADFVVDDATIVQYNANPTTRFCHAVGGSKYKSMTTSLGGRLYGVAKNANCISIEICSNKKNTKSLQASDTDWFFTEASLNNAAELARYLMQQYNITIDRVIMHHEVTGKICPNPFCVNSSRLSQWEAFKARIVNGTSTVTQTTTTSSTSKTTSSSTATQTNSTGAKYMYQGVDMSLVFNPTYYSNAYADLKAAFGTNATKLFNHFCQYGMNEGRNGSADFNVSVYKAKNPDLVAAFGNNLPKYYQHYVQYGYKENRKHC